MRLSNSVDGGFIKSLFRVGRVAPTPKEDAETLRTASIDVEAAWHRLGERGLFVIGHARTGTTILQDALNASPDIFLFGEPDFHRDPGMRDFRRRYNLMHRTLRNQETKGTFCPKFFAFDGRWQEYLLRLAEMHRYVGSKIAISNNSEIVDNAALFDFHSRHFYRSKYVFTFRNPLDATISTQNLMEYQGHGRPPSRIVLANFLSVIQLYIRMLRVFPHVHAVFTEEMNDETLAGLGRFLDIDLKPARGYYSDEKIHRNSIASVPRGWRADAEKALAIYRDFRTAAESGFELTQITQNAGNLDDRYLTPLGKLSTAVDLEIERLKSNPAAEFACVPASRRREAGANEKGASRSPRP